MADVTGVTMAVVQPRTLLSLNVDVLNCPSRCRGSVPTVTVSHGLTLQTVVFRTTESKWNKFQNTKVSVRASGEEAITVLKDKKLDSEVYAKEAWEALKRVRDISPLVQCITNYVAMDLSANVLLAAGASPAMVHGIEEVEEFVSIASVLSINIGTLSGDWVQSMHQAASKANALGKPWVLDPVAAGATQFRTKTCLRLVDLQPTIIRGNASEILALSGATLTVVKGVDSTHQSTDALLAAKDLAKSAKCIVAVSGATDLVTDGERVLAVSNGVPLLQKITATGCSVTAFIGAVLAVLPQKPLEAAAYALCLFGTIIFGVRYEVISNSVWHLKLVMPTVDWKVPVAYVSNYWMLYMVSQKIKSCHEHIYVTFDLLLKFLGSRSQKLVN